MTQRTFFPALRGIFGDWVYYSSLLPMREVAMRVSLADALHQNKGLSDMIQRKIKAGRAKDISQYLTSKERFFNALVIAVYKGDPEWHEFGSIRPGRTADITDDDIPDDARRQMGFLSFTGKEKLFAIDGQHRLVGMKEAISSKLSPGDDDVAVIFVAHKDTAKGTERTRRLFTTLNKTAKPVSKGGIIALDEDDVMAICCRRLVEMNPGFDGNRIAFRATTNLPPEDQVSLTTIGNLYDVLAIVFSRFDAKRPLKTLRFSRPSDDDLKDFYVLACDYFDRLAIAFKALAQFFEAKQHDRVVKKHRGDFGGHILFRPAGLKVVTEVVAALSESAPWSDAVRLASKIPQNLDERPYDGLLWDSGAGKMAGKLNVALTRDLLLYMLGAIEYSDSLAKKYERALGEPGKGKQLLKDLPSLA